MAAATRHNSREGLAEDILLHDVCLPFCTPTALLLLTRPSLNVSFMFVQAFYGYVTNSLGLLSDTVHMFFDCVALLVGLVAAVASKWPRSQKFPYGLGKMESLSGFANGILLM